MYEQERIPCIPGFDLFYINLFFILFRVFVVERRLHKSHRIKYNMAAIEYLGLNTLWVEVDIASIADKAESRPSRKAHQRSNLVTSTKLKGNEVWLQGMHRGIYIDIRSG